MDYPFVNIHTHFPDPSGVSVMSVRLDGGRGRVPYPAPPALYSAGIHPWDAEGMSPETETALLRELETNAGMAAVGETGLDYLRGGRLAQERIFGKQLEIAQHRELPVILHCVRAFEPMMNILRRYSLRGVVFHGFTGSWQQAERAFGAGYYISLGPNSLRSPKVRGYLENIPLNRLFMETDEVRTPVAEVYALAARLTGLGVEELREAVYANFKSIFE